MTEPLSRDEIDAEFARAHAGVVAERDALRVEVATLRKEREYRFADLTAARGRIEKLEMVRQQAARYVRAHAGQVVRLQDAATAEAYYETSCALDRALAALDEEDSK